MSIQFRTVFYDIRTFFFIRKIFSDVVGTEKNRNTSEKRNGIFLKFLQSVVQKNEISSEKILNSIF